MFTLFFLKSNKIFINEPEGGFYLTLDFEPFRHVLNSKGIKTSKDICEALLSEKGVAMLPGSVFGYDQDILTTRLCYVDFNGVAAMKASEDLGQEKELPEQNKPEHQNFSSPKNFC